MSLVKFRFISFITNFMNSIEQEDDEEELPRRAPIVNKETVRRSLSRAQIMKLLEEENPSEWEA